MEEIKLDPSVMTFKPELMNTEEGERNMTCALLKKDPDVLMKAYSAIYVCMEPEKETTEKYNSQISTCMSTKARAEEAAYDKEQAEKAKKA